MRNSIMTEKIARRGIRTPNEYEADSLNLVYVRQIMSANVVTLRVNDEVDTIHCWLTSDAPEARHQGYPVLDGAIYSWGSLLVAIY